MKRGPAVWNTFTLPTDPALHADACLLLNAATGFANQLQRVPGEKNRTEAQLRLERAVMVAIGGFHVHPGERRDEDGTPAPAVQPEPGGALDPQ